MNGWIKIHRKLLDNDMFNAEQYTYGQAWIYLLLVANYEPSTVLIGNKWVRVERGEVGRSGEFLRKKFGWSRGRYSRWLAVLQANKQAVQLKKGVTTLISICNYDDYQDGGTTDGQDDGTANDTRNGGQTIQQTSNLKRNKENKNNKKAEDFFDFNSVFKSPDDVLKIVGDKYEHIMIYNDVQQYAFNQSITTTKAKWKTLIKNWATRNGNKYERQPLPIYLRKKL